MKTIHFFSLGILLLLALAAGAGIYLVLQNKPASPTTINSFQDCATAGYPIMESYPEQCRTPDGRTFVRELEVTPLPSDTAVYIHSKSDLITVNSPKPLAEVSSPVTITGQARGSWYFEASFPVTIEDANGNVLGAAPAQAQGDWMTERFVPFEATLTFSAPPTATGTLILKKDNPSGLPEHADQLRIPIKFTANANK